MEVVGKAGGAVREGRGEGEAGREGGGGAVEAPLSQEMMEEEREHFKKIANSFLYYKAHVMKRVERLRRDYCSLPSSHRAMLPLYPSHLQQVVEAVERNQEFVQTMVSCAVGMFENSDVSQFDWSSGESVSPAQDFHMEKVKTTIKQFYRDWSLGGAAERDMCYKPIIDDIIHLFPPEKIASSEVSVLVPGAGLGRLVYEIARRGYNSQGNEFSMHMLFGSNFILNCVSQPFSHTIHPWVTQFSNMVSYDDQTAAVAIPDINPTSLPQYGLFSMTAGDFLEVYRTPDSWDCVACCFFIDTAHNIIRYMETIYHILRPGGYWINMGPLLYHYANMPGEFSLELSWEDILRIAREEIGFEILTERRGVPSHYIQNPSSMIHTTYKCVYLVARKPEKTTPTHQREHSVTNGDVVHETMPPETEATPPDPWPL